MDRSNQVTLITENRTTDSIGQSIIGSVSEVTIFCNVKSIGRSEWLAAGQLGFIPEFVVTVNRHEYDGQKRAKLGNTTYAIYRTFAASGEDLELYLKREAGVTPIATTT